MIKIILFIVIVSSVSIAQNYGAWSLTDPLHIPRWHSTSVELENGNILVSGGISKDSGNISDAEIYNYKIEKWEVIHPMVLGRAYHLLLKLSNGNIMAISGGNYEKRSCEVYDTTTKIWTLIDSLNYERTFGETATLLGNGDVLVVGGYYLAVGNTKILNSCEIYNARTKKWIVTDSLKIDREYHTATKLLDGRILVAGGFSGTQKELTDCEIYDPNKGEWSEAAPLNIARFEHTATLLPDGKVLVTGGENYSNPTSPWLKTCELYDPIQNKWTIVKSLSVAHSLHSALLLNNGLILITGGSFNTGIWELYDPKNFTNIYSGSFPNDTVSPSLINLIPNGKVLSAGGMTWTNASTPLLSASNLCFLYDPNGISNIEGGKTIVEDFKLSQNYPNPFNPTTLIKYKLSTAGNVKLNVYDILGRELETIVNCFQQSGNYIVPFDGSKLSSGIYLYKLEVFGDKGKNYISTKKMELLK